MPLAPRPATRPAGRPAAVALLLLLTLTLGGCATWDRTLEAFGLRDTDRGMQTPEHLAMDGMEELNRGNYRQALEIFQTIKERHPFSSVGVLAELKAADATYYLRRYDEALLLYQAFENNHPTNEAIPYVLFQMGMCHYQRIDTIDRDPAHALNAIATFSRLARAFPDSPYEEEAQARIMAGRDFMARHEMFVATFYVKTKEYDQAERRLDYLLATYPDSEVAPRADELLARLAAGDPPTRTWRDWLPDIALGSWRDFFGSISPVPSGMGEAGPDH